MFNLCHTCTVTYLSALAKLRKIMDYCSTCTILKCLIKNFASRASITFHTEEKKEKEKSNPCHLPSNDETIGKERKKYPGKHWIS